MSTAYKVVAPLVLVTGSDGAVHHCYQGSVLEDLRPEQVDHLLGLGFIAKVGTADAVIPILEPDAPEDSYPAQPKPEPPAKAATHKIWVDFAVTCGADRAEAEGLAKAELIELYG